MWSENPPGLVLDLPWFMFRADMEGWNIGGCDYIDYLGCSKDIRLTKDTWYELHFETTIDSTPEVSWKKLKNWSAPFSTQLVLLWHNDCSIGCLGSEHESPTNLTISDISTLLGIRSLQTILSMPPQLCMLRISHHSPAPGRGMNDPAVQTPGWLVYMSARTMAAHGTTIHHHSPPFTTIHFN